MSRLPDPFWVVTLPPDPAPLASAGRVLTFTAAAEADDYISGWGNAYHLRPVTRSVRSAFAAEVRRLGVSEAILDPRPAGGGEVIALAGCAGSAGGDPTPALSRPPVPNTAGHRPDMARLVPPAPADGLVLHCPVCRRARGFTPAEVRRFAWTRWPECCGGRMALAPEDEDRPPGAPG